MLAALPLWLGVAAADSGTAGGELRLERVAGEGWQAHDVALEWRWLEGAVPLTLRIRRLDLADADLVFDGIELNCPRLELTPERVTCPRATLSVAARQLERTRAAARFSYTVADGSWEVGIDGLVHCGGEVDLQVAGKPAESRAAVVARGLAIDCLVRNWQPGWEAFGPQGALSGEGAASVTATGLAAGFELHSRDLKFDSPDGLYAAEGVALQVAGDLRREDAAWRGTVEATLGAGAVYAAPILLDSAEGVVAFTASGGLGADGRLGLERFTFRQGEALAAEGTATLDPALPWPPIELDLELARGDLAPLYRTFAQPFLIGTMFDDLAPLGTLGARLERRAGAWSARVDLHEVGLHDGRGRYALSGLDGTLAWGDSEAPASRIDWDGGHVLRLALGAAEARFVTHGGHAELLAPLRLPLVDGALEIAQLNLDGLDVDAPVVELRAALEPLSLEALSIAFGWVPMAGTVGGEIPVLRLAERTLTVDGSLRVDAFDGTVLIDNLEVERALGPLPVLRADVVIDDLDLELLTRTFTIGRIDGRIGGRIDGLELQDWRPVRFDAELVTPPEDRSRHRISQRAIDSLSSLGGLSGVLSRSALRFFDDFGYDRLGLRCRLRGAVCELDGVAPAAGGYYLVKGGGLPRIDVIGHQRRVDWAELIERVQRAMAAPAPRVE